MNFRFFSEKQLFNKIYRLSAFNRNESWQCTKSHKTHIDCFEANISPGDYYYRFKIGENRSHDLKLSSTSMDRFAFEQHS